ncbi:MAG TPA: HAD family hydrolase [Casimicrobiaceae bacterium]|jgi:FMN phosphatase YigB (HAD superfamily)
MPLRAPIDAVCFDWGGTLMSEAGPEALPMGMWPEVSAISGARECLATLYGLAPLCIATNATVSRRPMIERALARVGLRDYIATIFCYTELGYRKSQPEFWRVVESALQVPLARIAMVGDSLEHDALAPRTFGVQAVWFNEGGLRTPANAGVPEVRSLVEFAELVRRAVRAGSP